MFGQPAEFVDGGRQITAGAKEGGKHGVGGVGGAEEGGAKTGHLPLGEGDGDGLMGKGHDLLKQ